MDPNAALARIRELIKDMNTASDDLEAAMIGSELATHVEGLDTWLKQGGFLPHEWRRLPWDGDA